MTGYISGALSLKSPKAIAAARGGTARYVVQRLLQALFVVWAAFTLSFLLLYALPGNAATQKLQTSSYISQAQYEQLEHYYGLDQPLLTQYVKQLTGILHGDLGISVATGMPVSQLIGNALPQTLGLTLLALLIALTLAFVVSTLAIVSRFATVRRACWALPAIGSSIPGFWIGLILLWLFSFSLHIFPGVGDGSFAAMILPAATLSLRTGSLIAQVLTNSLDKEWHSPYMQTVRTVGYGRLAALFQQALPNASISVMTVIATHIGELLAGTVVVETVFSRNGIGRITQVAVTSQDMAVVQGVVIFTAAVYAGVNLVVDLLYPLIDPRIRNSSRRGRK
ncbi:ABC transporter permease [Bifidobacterium scaligerum]|uniref:Peptide ABC transporter permease n=1 Tax=Bifidobacterium scaligerum TaxID=2052656 RepID=A0A2M9HP82_9BIFI|nr:ABC transporter permease [Bifidobacterium scaligerum]PJM78617.1 peptide ABC transporter permease [Bifidobacterium scaligerum]